MGAGFTSSSSNKKLVGAEIHKELLTPPEVAIESGLIPGPGPLYLREGEPVIVGIEKFQFTYQCKHCGHEWSEKHEEEHKERI